MMPACRSRISRHGRFHCDTHPLNAAMFLLGDLAITFEISNRYDELSEE